MDTLFLKKQFPLLANSSLIYLDSAATSHKPQVVINAMANFYRQDYAPVHRGIYDLAEGATYRYEEARKAVARFINAEPHEIVFTSGTTDSINMVAAIWAQNSLGPGDEIVMPEAEHHANIVVWYELARRRGVIIRSIRLTDAYAFDQQGFLDHITSRTRLVTLSLSSHIFGNYPADFLYSIIEKAHAVGAKVLADAAQAVGHTALDVKKIGVDFLAFSAHKMFGPTGIGVLYVHKNMSEALDVYRVGGGMVQAVELKDGADYSVVWKKMPSRLEAGTPPFVQAIGMSAALGFIQEHIDFSALACHENMLIQRMKGILRKYDDIVIMQHEYGCSSVYQHIVTFYSTRYHAHDIAAWLDSYTIAVRAGHHCSQPIHTRLGIVASVRVSVHAYTTVDDIDACGDALDKLYNTV